MEEDADVRDNGADVSQIVRRQPTFHYSQAHDPEPLLKLHSEDKSSEVVDESVFLEKIVAERRKVLKLGYVPSRQYPLKRVQALALDPLAQQVVLPPQGPNGSLLLSMKTSLKQQKLCMRERSLVASTRMRRSSLQRKLSQRLRNHNGQTNIDRESLATSIASRWDMSGTSITKLIMTMTIHHPRSFRDTSSIFSILT